MDAETRGTECRTGSGILHVIRTHHINTLGQAYGQMARRSPKQNLQR
jgi:hypothetical protein